MLGKLLKYDLKWNYKPLLVFYGLAMFFSLMARGLSEIENSLLFTIIGQICYGVSIAMMINIIINNLMRCWARLVRNVYKDESYLTHTLPVRKKDIFSSKVLAGIITMFTSILVIFICLFISYYSPENMNGLKTALTSMSSTIGIQTSLFVVIFIGIVFLEFVFMLISGYLGIILGHRSNNQKVIKSVIFGFLAFMVMSITSVLILFIVALFNQEIMNLFNTVAAPSADTLKVLLLGGTVLYTIYILLYYLLGKKLLAKGVNVD